LYGGRGADVNRRAAIHARPCGGLIWYNGTDLLDTAQGETGMASDRPQHPSSVWQGASVRLRAIEPEDAAAFHAWNQDSDTGRFLDFVWPPQSLASAKEWAQKTATQEVKDDQYACVIENLTGELVGYINAHTVDRRVGSFRYGVGVRAEYRGRGYAGAAILLFVRYFFEELRYQKVTATVYACNPASIRLHEKLGFQLEGRVRRVVYTQGHYFDELYYGMTCEEFAERYGQAVPITASTTAPSAAP
jgi:RimJ/RimL family protein N-acetyltransferase